MRLPAMHLALFLFSVALCVALPAAGAWGQAGVLWRAATGGQIRGRPAVGPDGATYALSEDLALYAWVSGNSLLWRKDLGSMPADSLAVSGDGTIYAGLRDGELAAVNPRGARLWSVRLDGTPAGDPAVALDGTVLVGSSGGTLLALSHLGRRVWSVTLPGAVTQSPVIDGAGTIYVVSADRRLYALTPWGEFKWSLPLAAAPDSPAIAADGTVILGTSRGDVVAVSADGEVLWQRSLGAPVVGVLTTEKEIIAATGPGLVVGFAPVGRELWRASAGKPLAGAPFAGTQGMLLAALDGTILALDDAHKVSGSFTPKAPGGTAVGPHGEILIGGRDWVVYAIDPAKLGAHGAGTAPWPQPGHDAMHSGRTDAAPPSDNSALLEQNPDYLYLQGFAVVRTREGIQLLLSEIAGRIASRSLGKSAWYVARMLEQVVGTGLLVQERRNQKLENDFPDLRAQAAALLGRVGTTGSRATLLAVLPAETDNVALAAEIRALGAIASDSDGASERAIARAFTRRIGQAKDNRLAAAVVDALGRISVYEGALGEQSSIISLLAISGGAYDAGVRQDARSVLQGRPKVDIIDHEE